MLKKNKNKTAEKANFTCINKTKNKTFIKTSYKRSSKKAKSNYKQYFNKGVLNVLSLTLRVIQWIPAAFSSCAVSVPMDFNHFIGKCHVVLDTRGVPGYILYLKNVRGALLAALAGEQDKTKTFKVKCCYDGIPMCLGPLIKVVRNCMIPGNSKVPLQLINTVLFCTRALSVGKEVKLKSITEPAKQGPFKITKHLRSFWKHMGMKKHRADRIPKCLSFRNYHFTTKSGPNGHAMWSSLNDFVLLSKEKREKLIILGGDKMANNFKKLDLLVPYLRQMNLFSFDGEATRKIVGFPDMEDKVRVVAILDYFSQTVLKPLHIYLFRILKRIPQDCTFTQDSFKEKIKGWTYFVSVDLTAATDRFPIHLIREVLLAILPQRYVDAFISILIDEPFLLKSNLGKSSYVKYQCGNPMGAYASWSSFTIAHHFVVFACCRELRIPYSSAKYIMLGDDIVFGEKRLADLYINVMTDLGVEINLSKTHESKLLCEFAKRLVYQGSEITPFPISALRESSKRYFQLVNLFSELESKGYVNEEGIPAVVESFYGIIKPMNAKKRAQWRDESHFCDLIMKVMRGRIPAHEALNDLMRRFSYPVRPLREEEGIAILSNVAIETFAESNPLNKTNENGDPLGDLAIHIVTYLSGLNEDLLGVIDYDFSCIPILNQYGLIEESYLSLSKLARKIDTTEGGKWPILLKSMTLPLSDKVFIERTSETYSRATAMIGKHLRSRFDFLASPLGKTMLGS
jgi:hypothetical protein